MLKRKMRETLEREVKFSATLSIHGFGFFWLFSF